MKNSNQETEEEIINMLSMGERPLNELQGELLVEIWNESDKSPGLMINRFTGMSLSKEDLDIYMDRAGWAGIGFIITMNNNGQK